MYSKCYVFKKNKTFYNLERIEYMSPDNTLFVLRVQKTDKPFLPPLH